MLLYELKPIWQLRFTWFNLPLQSAQVCKVDITRRAASPWNSLPAITRMLRYFIRHCDYTLRNDTLLNLCVGISSFTEIIGADSEILNRNSIDVTWYDESRTTVWQGDRDVTSMPCCSRTFPLIWTTDTQSPMGTNRQNPHKKQLSPTCMYIHAWAHCKSVTLEILDSVIAGVDKISRRHRNSRRQPAGEVRLDYSKSRKNLFSSLTPDNAGTEVCEDAQATVVEAAAETLLEFTHI